MKNKKLLSVIGALGLGITAIPFHTNIANAQSVIEEMPKGNAEFVVSDTETYENKIVIGDKIIKPADNKQSISIYDSNMSPVTVINQSFEDLSVSKYGIVIRNDNNLIKYDFTGQQLWNTTLTKYSSTIESDPLANFEPYMITLDDGSILIPYQTHFNTPDEIPILKYNKDGQQEPLGLEKPPATGDYDDITMADFSGGETIIKKFDNKLVIVVNNHYTRNSVFKYNLDTNELIESSNRIITADPFSGIDVQAGFGISKDRIIFSDGDYIYIYDMSGNLINKVEFGFDFSTYFGDKITFKSDGGFYLFQNNQSATKSNTKIINEFDKDGDHIDNIEIPASIQIDEIIENPDGSISLRSGNQVNNGTLNKPVQKFKGTNNLAVGVPVPNSLEMTMDTNTIDFTGYDGVSDTTNDTLSITVKSGLNYDLSATLTDEIRHSDGVTTMDKSHLRIKTSDDSDYKEFTDIGTPVTIVNNKQYGEHKHNINFKLIADSAVKSGDYEASVKFEVTQK